MRRRAVAALAASSAFALAAAPLRAAEEVPFIVTPDHVTVAMLDLAGVGPSDFVLDLGSGDGRIVITAAKRFGARGLGVEIVPDLVARSRRNAELAGVADRARFVEQDLFLTDLSAASVITMYLLPEVNLQLRPRLLALAPGTRIVSHDWDMGEWPPDRVVVVDAPDKPIGREKRSRLYLWVVPAQLAGEWCGQGALQGATLRIDAPFQRVHGSLRVGDDTRPVNGRIEGRRLSTGAFDAVADGDRLRVTAADVPALRGARFERCRSG